MGALCIDRVAGGLEGGNTEMDQWLNSRAADLCFCAKLARGTCYDWKALYRDEMVMWLPKDHPLAGAASYPIRNLEHEAFIHALADHDTDQDRLIREEALHIEDRYETTDGFTTCSMV
ncbi:LysR family transcriptional regulator substrate-binding protein [Atopobiaceae bacterium HCP3S3_A4]